SLRSVARTDRRARNQDFAAIAGGSARRIEKGFCRPLGPGRDRRRIHRSQDPRMGDIRPPGHSLGSQSIPHVLLMSLAVARPAVCCCQNPKSQFRNPKSVGSVLLMSFQLDCPECGTRPIWEFHYGGPVRKRPEGQVAERKWAEYLYNRPNTCGEESEWW